LNSVQIKDDLSAEQDSTFAFDQVALKSKELSKVFHNLPHIKMSHQRRTFISNQLESKSDKRWNDVLFLTETYANLRKIKGKNATLANTGDNVPT